jgi:hypothetical protein
LQHSLADDTYSSKYHFPSFTAGAKDFQLESLSQAKLIELEKGKGFLPESAWHHFDHTINGLWDRSPNNIKTMATFHRSGQDFYAEEHDNGELI